MTQTPLYGERAIAEAELICFDNPRPGRPYEVSIELPEFTCKCPFSGYPDFAVLRLIYQPCLLYTSPSPRDQRGSRMPSSA